MKITVKPNSALLIEGDFEIVDIDGNPYNTSGREKVSLCRCGLSKIAPFCDGSHKGEFISESKAFNYEKKQ
jgi:CDGSH-type Zn-finger protein